MCKTKRGDVLKKIIILFLIGLLFACTQHPHWVRPNTTNKELKKDSLACTKETDSLVLKEFGMIIPIAIYNDYYDRCMLNKGYVKQR
jgi:hypothetical protein